MPRPDAHRFTPPPAILLVAAILFLLVAAAAPAAGPPAAGKAIAFLTGPNEGDALDIANAYLESQRRELGLSEADLGDVIVSNRYLTRHNGVTHIVLQQRLGGVEVHNGLLSVNVARDGSVINLHNRFVSDLAAKANIGSPLLTDRTAIVAAAEHFGLTPAELAPLRTDGGADLRAVFADAALSDSEIPVRLVYQPLEDGSVRLAWQTNLDLVHSPDWWNVSVDAVTGEVIYQYNWTSYDSYLVVPFPPFSDLQDSGGQSLVVDPADPTASPFAWHDTDGIAGGEFTDTRGNNVNAQEDRDGNNSGGFRPDGDMGGPMLEFNFPYNPAMQPGEGSNLSAAITNLFYGNNVMHDLTYHYGFDEPAGNFQLNTYGNGGIGGDQVEADAQDNFEGTPPSTNNANFSTPPDGFPGRMQMFVWTNPFSQFATVNPPSSIAGSYIANPSNNGGTGNGLTGDLELVVDGVAPTTDACEAITNDLTGNIALIVWNQGACNSSVFVANAAAAGAVGAVIIDNNVNPTTNFGGSPTIPSVAVGSNDGQLFLDTLLVETVNVTLEDNPDGQINRDSDLDHGIISHEYGHGISNRLTGGPANVNCLSGSERASEGWSDFWTLVLTAKSSDTPTTSKGVGNYVIFEPINGPGIRNFPYSTDLGVNPQTYADIASTNVPHGVGEIFMSMVWEMYWELVTKHGFDGDFYFGTGGNNLTIQLVVDGMKLQPCNPTFLDARDAILAADLANTGGDNECEIWRAFAKRGAGLSAIAGSINTGDETEAFDIPGGCPSVAPAIFADGFESGDTLRWSSSAP